MFYRTAILAAAIAIAFSAQANATNIVHPVFHYVKHVKAPVTTPSDPKGGAGGGGGGVGWCTGGCVWVAGFIGAVATAIIIHEIIGPACARRGLKNGYDTPTLWRPLCNRKSNVISVRG